MVNSSIVDLPEPQLQKKPTLIGISSFSVTRPLIYYAVSLN